MKFTLAFWQMIFSIWKREELFWEVGFIQHVCCNELRPGAEAAAGQRAVCTRAGGRRGKHPSPRGAYHTTECCSSAVEKWLLSISTKKSNKKHKPSKAGPRHTLTPRPRPITPQHRPLTSSHCDAVPSHRDVPTPRHDLCVIF